MCIYVYGRGRVCVLTCACQHCNKYITLTAMEGRPNGVMIVVE